METRVEELEQVVKSSIWTEDKMASVHAELITSEYTDLKTELLEELQRRTDERVVGEKTIGSERRKDIRAIPW